MRFPLVLAAVAALAWTPALAQDLKVTVVGRDSIVLTPADLKALPRAKATFQAKGHAGDLRGRDPEGSVSARDRMLVSRSAAWRSPPGSGSGP